MSFHSQWRTSAYLILGHILLSLSLGKLFYHVDYFTLLKLILIPIVLFDVQTMGFFLVKKSVPAKYHDSLLSGPSKLLGLLLWAFFLFIEFIILKTTYPIITYIVLSVLVLSSHRSFSLPEIKPVRLFASEFSFILGFHLMLVSLSFFPEIFSGEKAMDASFLGQYMRHTTGELYDPWFSFKPMGYYTFGYFTWAQFLKVFGLPLKFAYPIALSLVGAFIIQILYALYSLYSKSPRPAVIGALTTFALPTLPSLYQSMRLSQNFGRFWGSTRIYPNGYFSEYTFWSLSFGDLHPHVMSYPLILALIFFLFLYYERERIFYSLEQILALGLIWGCLCMTNMWDTLFVAILLAPLLVYLFFKNRSGALSLVASGFIALELFILARYQMGVHVAKVFAVEVLRSNFLLPTFLQSGWLVLISLFYGLWKKEHKFEGLLALGLFITLGLSLTMLAMDHLNTIFKSHTFVFLCSSALFILILLRAGKLKLLYALGLISLAASLFTLYHREAGRADLKKRVGLDAIRYLDVVSKADYEIVTWLNENVEGTPLVVEFPGRTFVHGTPRISMLTGLPTFLGWDFHVQLRGAKTIEIDQRKREISEFYQTRDPVKAHSWAREKQIRFIVIGEREYTHFPELNINFFDGYPALYKPRISFGKSRLFEVL